MMQAKPFGVTKDGRPVFSYTISNRNGMRASVMTLGATLLSVIVPQKDGEIDVALGYDTPAEYETNRPYFGAICGRYANRIARGKFTLNGKEYTLAVNNGPNHLHGGIDGLSFRIWDIVASDEGSVTLAYDSPDGEEGYPGNLRIAVTYSLDDENVLSIRYEAVSDADTVLNVTNHTYWNLNGHGSGPATGHILEMPCSYFCPCDKDALVNGEIVPVKGTPFDFLSAHAIGERINDDDEQIRFGGGYDHCFLLDGSKPIVLKGEKSGVQMEITTDLPAVQLYTANGLGAQRGKGGAAYNNRSAVCLETQSVPDSPNKPQFPSTVIKANEPFVTVTAHRFTF